MIKALTTLLDTNVAALTRGMNLFAGTRPHDAPDTCVVLLERVGMPMDPMQANDHHARIQVLTRGASYFAARTLAHAAFDALAAKTNINRQLSGWWLHSIDGTRPAFVGKDADGRVEFSANLTVRMRKES